ncbi:MAG: ATP-binding cassette domain-containing protein [Proteobacteria bacterium]|nr:ATP-binding cassette domain-containing protein [Pseudomonadota bacterium]MDE3208418.1 ATP-binding cassette domain-containing protein [Pseudomonadota bacterium]
MDVISFNDVNITLSKRPILSRLSFDIKENRFIGLLGPNGSGKTTLFKTILGLVTPDTGTVSIFGLPAKKGNPIIGYIPQFRTTAYNLRLCGWDYIASAVNGHKFGLPLINAITHQEIAHFINLVQATNLAHRPLSSLSGGERQRLLLAQALIGKPSLLLLDEPLTNLDPGNQQSMISLIREIQQELGITVLLSAHELNPLLPVMDEVLYLGHGQAVLGQVNEVINSAILSKLYGSKIEVVQVNNQIFVMSENINIEHNAHQHGEA